MMKISWQGEANCAPVDSRFFFMQWTDRMIIYERLSRFLYHYVCENWAVQAHGSIEENLVRVTTAVVSRHDHLTHLVADSARSLCPAKQQTRTTVCRRVVCSETNRNAWGGTIPLGARHVGIADAMGAPSSLAIAINLGQNMMSSITSVNGVLAQLYQITLRPLMLRCFSSIR